MGGGSREIYERFLFNMNNLSQKNQHGKSFLYYVLNADDDESLLTFLMEEHPKHWQHQEYYVKETYLKMLNDQFKKIEHGKTLFEHLIEIYAKDAENDTKVGYSFFTVIFMLLEEIGAIVDIRNDVPIDKLLELEKSKSGLQLYNLDDLFGNIIAYYSQDDPNYFDYKSLLKSLNPPFFEMLFQVIEGKEEKFTRNFFKNSNELEKTCRERYGVSLRVYSCTTGFLFILIVAAITNDRKRIAEHIFKYESFIEVSRSIRKSLNIELILFSSVFRRTGCAHLPPKHAS